MIISPTIVRNVVSDQTLIEMPPIWIGVSRPLMKNS